MLRIVMRTFGVLRFTKVIALFHNGNRRADLLAERGIEVTYETIRCWVDRFGPHIASRIRTTRSKPASIWHLDEMFVSIRGRQTHLWRAIDDEGEALEVLVTSKRDKWAALRLMRKLLRKQGVTREDRHRSISRLRRCFQRNRAVR